MRPSPRKLAPTPSAHMYKHDVYRNTIYRHTVCTHPGAPRDTVGRPAHCTCGRCALVGGGQGGRCGREQRWSASSGASHVECAVREGVSGAAGSVGSRRACALTLQKEGSKFMFINPGPKPKPHLHPMPKPQPCQRAQRSTLIMSAAALMSLPMARILKSTP